MERNVPARTGRRRIGGAAAVIACGLALSGPAHAGGFGLELGMIAAEQSDAIMQVGLRAGPIRPGHPGIEFGLSVLPSALVLLIADLDLALPLPLGSSEGPAAIVRAGISPIAGPYAGAAFGFNIGAGVVQPMGSNVGLRGDVVYRVYPGGDGFYSVTSLTAGIVWGH